MTETPSVRPGSVWEDCDKRCKGRTVHVDSVDGQYAFVTDSNGRTSRIRLDRFRPISTGYRLVEDAPEPVTEEQAGDET